MIIAIKVVGILFFILQLSLIRFVYLYRRVITQDQGNQTLRCMRSLLFKASELERYAHSVAAANRSIAQLGSSSSESILQSDDFSAAQLLGRAQRLGNSLVARAHETMTQLFSVVTNSSNLSGSGPDKGMLAGGDRPDQDSASILRVRIVGHLVRIFNELGRYDVLQSALADTVVSPLARYIM